MSIRTREFIVRTILVVLFGFIISYYLSMKIPHIFDVVQNEKLVLANMLFMIIFTLWFLLAYIARFKFLIPLTILFTVLAVAL